MSESSWDRTRLGIVGDPRSNRILYKISSLSYYYLQRTADSHLFPPCRYSSRCPKLSQDIQIVILYHIINSNRKRNASFQPDLQVGKSDVYLIEESDSQRSEYSRYFSQYIPVSKHDYTALYTALSWQLIRTKG